MSVNANLLADELENAPSHGPWVWTNKERDLIVKALRSYVNRPSEHPWADFLRARKRAIDWMHKEQGYHDIVIREALAMDEEQIRLIRMSIAEDLPRCENGESGSRISGGQS